MMTWDMFHTVTFTALENVVATANWRPGIVLIPNLNIFIMIGT
jgi:hypothetical protein